MKLSRLSLALVILGASGAAHAAFECRFNDNNARQIMTPGVQPVITPLRREPSLRLRK